MKFNFNFNDKDYSFKDETDLYENFLSRFDYDTLDWNDEFIFIYLENGNEYKIKIQK